jgi:hypothetical protein
VRLRKLTGSLRVIEDSQVVQIFGLSREWSLLIFECGAAVFDEEFCGLQQQRLIEVTKVLSSAFDEEFDKSGIFLLLLFATSADGERWQFQMQDEAATDKGIGE